MKLLSILRAHVLALFPLAAKPVKIAALNACRDVERGLVK